LIAQLSRDVLYYPSAVEIQEINSVRLEGVFASLPVNEVDNLASLCGIYGEKALSIVKATGINKRRVAQSGVTPYDLCISAAEKLFSALMAGTDEKSFLESFGAVLFVSFTEKVKMPAAACRAQAHLSLPSDVMAIDLSLACSGWCTALNLAAQIASATRRRVLILDGDVQSVRIKEGDEALTPVLSDGGTAAVVAPDEKNTSKPWRFAFSSDGAKGDALTFTEGDFIHMDGFGVYKFVATSVVSFLKNFIASESNAGTSFDVFVPHQANVYMIRQLAKSLNLEDKLLISADDLGNMASASIPTTIAYRGIAPKEGAVLAAGFGGGLAASAAAFYIDEGIVTGVCEYGS
jgi:3-oxoacyl-[acyl-carrier-protein] synthase-3